MNSRQKENQDLLEQQRHRLDDTEAEREEWLKRVEAARSAHTELQSVVETEISRRTEISALQKQLSDAHIALQEERNNALKISREIDALQVVLSQDDRRRQELMSLVEPMEQDGAVYKNCRTGESSRTHKSVKESRVLHSAGGGPTALGQFTRHLGNIQEKPRSVIRTVQLPNEQATGLARELEEVRRVAETERMAHAEKVNALKEERRSVEEEHRREAEEMHLELKDLHLRTAKCDNGILQTTKELLTVRHEYRLKDRWLAEHLEDARNQVRTADKRVAMVQERAIQEAKRNTKTVERQTDEIIAKLRAQTMTSQEQLKMVREQHAALQKIFREKVNRLQDQIDRVAGKQKDIEVRRTLEGEGQRKDIQQLTKLSETLEDRVRKGDTYSGVHDQLQGEIRKVSRQVAEADQELRNQAAQLRD